MLFRSVVFNKEKVKPTALSTYEDLADPKWKNRLLVRSGTHVYNLSLLGSIIAANGEAKAEEWAKGVVANLARPPKGGDADQLKAVAAGEGDVAISNTYYFARLLKSEKPEDKEAAAKYRADRAAVLDRYPLKPDVRAAVLANDVAALAPLGGGSLWYWFEAREAGQASPWYPGLRVFHQDRPGAWRPLLQRVRGALDAFHPSGTG